MLYKRGAFGAASPLRTPRAKGAWSLRSGTARALFADEEKAARLGRLAANTAHSNQQQDNGKQSNELFHVDSTPFFIEQPTFFAVGLLVIAFYYTIFFVIRKAFFCEFRNMAEM